MKPNNSRILLFLEQTENRRLLSQWLEMHYEVLVSDCEVQSGQAVPLLNEPFDLCVLDGPALDRMWEWVLARKKAEPVFLPFLLITFRPDVKLLTRHLWQSVDDLITKPIEKLELQARVEILLRSRQLSLQLRTANEQLQLEISKRDRAEAALRKSESQFRKLVESNIVGIMVADFAGKITEANDAFLEMVGYTREDLLCGNIRWDTMTPPEYRQQDQQVIAEIKASGASTTFEKEYIRKDNTRIPVLIGVVLLEEVECVCFIIDISDRKRAEAETQQALQRERELTQLRSRFVSMVSHEFRNPLNLIAGFTQILQRRGNTFSVEQQADFWRRIKEAVNRMTALLDDVLVMGKAESGKLEFNPIAIEVAKFSRELVEEIKVSSDVHIINFTSKGHCTKALLDENLLRQILSNLLTNAIKYSPVGSKIDFKLQCENEAVIFQIKDQGIGIPESDQEQLFESFYRAKNVGTIPGTGLGLAIVKQAVDLHKGAIAVNSQVGVGTTFTVTIPLHSPAPLNITRSGEPPG